MMRARKSHRTLVGTHRAESGFVLPTAIFLLVILAALGAYMVALSRTSQISSALDLQGSRGYQAARVGVEWAAWQVVQNPTPSCTAAPITLAFPPGMFTGFTVTVSCVQLGPYADGANTVTVYQATSTATSGVAGTPDYVERQIQATFGK